MKPVAKWRLAIERDIANNNVPGIIDGISAITEHGEDPDYAENLCLQLSEHRNADVRATAILGFGHIARVHGILKEQKIRQVINKGARSSHDLERVHSESARADIEHLLGWSFDT